MRALIRHLKTRRFYAGDERWTAKREKACDFVTSFRALTFAHDKRLRGVEVVMTLRGVKELMSIREDF